MHTFQVHRPVLQANSAVETVAAVGVAAELPSTIVVSVFVVAAATFAAVAKYSAEQQ